MSDKATDPAAWSELAKQIGVGGVFGVLCLLAMCGAGYLLYRATIGPTGFVRAIAVDLHSRAVAFLAKLEASIDQLSKSAEQDHKAQEELRVCAREFAHGMQAIAAKIGADVEHAAATIEAETSAAV